MTMAQDTSYEAEILSPHGSRRNDRSKLVEIEVFPDFNPPPVCEQSKMDIPRRRDGDGISHSAAITAPTNHQRLG